MDPEERPDPAAYSPRLTWWGHTWRALAMVAVSAIVWPQYVGAQLSRMPALFALDIALGVVSLVAVCFRRRWPLPVALLTNALTCVSGLASGPATLAAASVATGRRWPSIVVTGATAVAASLVYVGTQPATRSDPLWVSLVAALVVMAATLGWGMYIGSRRELLWTLQHRAERAEAEQELRAREARTTERSRIAREMHDVLAHRISQISLHAGALAFREDLAADEMRASAGVIQAAANEALTDLRGVLGVLRDRSGELLVTPQPTYDDVAGLVEEARLSGLHVDYRDRLEGIAPLPEVVGRTLFRIVQEGITNVRKHAPGATLSIDLSGSPDDGVQVRLRNPLGFGRTTTPGAGLGLVGLTERAELRGGRLQAGRDGTSFELLGWIPWAA